MGCERRGDLKNWLETMYYPEPNTGCYLWLGSIDRQGYGRTKMRGLGMVRAHRAAWYITKGNWPKGILMHSCDTPGCVNIDHLKEGSPKENAQDCLRKGRNFQASKRVCQNGHEFTPENIYAHRGYRYCKKCLRERYYRSKDR